MINWFSHNFLTNIYYLPEKIELKKKLSYITQYAISIARKKKLSTKNKNFSVSLSENLYYLNLNLFKNKINVTFAYIVYVRHAKHV